MAPPPLGGKKSHFWYHVLYPLKLIEVIKVNMDLSLFIQWLGLLSCKQLIAPTRHRAFILKRSVRSCLHTSNIVGCTIGFRNLQGHHRRLLWGGGRWMSDISPLSPPSGGGPSTVSAGGKTAFSELHRYWYCQKSIRKARIVNKTV